MTRIFNFNRICLICGNILFCYKNECTNCIRVTSPYGDHYLTANVS